MCHIVVLHSTARHQRGGRERQVVRRRTYNGTPNLAKPINSHMRRGIGEGGRGSQPVFAVLVFPPRI